MADLVYPETLEEAREYVADGMMEPNGIACPCCEQRAKLYKRPLNGSMAAMLIVLSHINNGNGWTYIEEWREKSGIKLNGGGDYGKLAYWNLVESMPVAPEQDKGSSGQWKMTKKGFEFSAGSIKVPSHALIYNNKVMGFSDKLVGINECLGKKFSYMEVMESPI
jgi:hypothetical protein